MLQVCLLSLFFFFSSSLSKIFQAFITTFGSIFLLPPFWFSSVKAHGRSLYLRVRPVLVKYKIGQMCSGASLPLLLKPFPFLPLLTFFFFFFSALPQPQVFLNQKSCQKLYEYVYCRLKQSSWKSEKQSKGESRDLSFISNPAQLRVASSSIFKHDSQ